MKKVIGALLMIISLVCFVSFSYEILFGEIIVFDKGIIVGIVSLLIFYSVFGSLFYLGFKLYLKKTDIEWPISAETLTYLIFGIGALIMAVGSIIEAKYKILITTVPIAISLFSLAYKTHNK